jgi:hypothetical protein
MNNPFEKLNAAIPPFAKQLQGKLRAAAPQETGDGWESVRSYTSKRDGITDRIAVRFSRYLVFREFGAGKGMGGSKGGSRWTNAKGQSMTTNSSSLGKMGTGARNARPWYNPIIKQEHSRLAELVADTVADGSISSLKYWLLKGTE